MMHTLVKMLSNVATIKFRSTEAYADNKFRLEWYTEGTVSDIFKITYPLYTFAIADYDNICFLGCGSQYGPNDLVGVLYVNMSQIASGAVYVECRFTIEAPIGKSVKLKVANFATSLSGTSCVYNQDYFMNPISGIHVRYRMNFHFCEFCSIGYDTFVFNRTLSLLLQIFSAKSNDSAHAIKSSCSPDPFESQSTANNMFVLVRFNPPSMQAGVEQLFMATYEFINKSNNVIILTFPRLSCQFSLRLRCLLSIHLPKLMPIVNNKLSLSIEILSIEKYCSAVI